VPKPDPYSQAHLRDSLSGGPGPIPRTPLSYDPPSSAGYDFEALPASEAFRDLGLDFHPRDAMKDVVPARVFSTVAFNAIACVTLWLALVFVGPTFPLEYTLPLGFILSFVWLAHRAIGRRLTLWGALEAAFALPCALLLSLAFGGLLGHRMGASCALGLAAFCFLAWLGPAPFRFYRDWLATSPRLLASPDGLPTVSARPRLLPLAALLLAAVFLPAWSPCFALAIFLALLTFSLLRPLPVASSRSRLRELTQAIGEARRVVALYEAYGRNPHSVPGAWTSPQSHLRRLLTSRLLVLGTSLPLLIGLSGFFPWDAPIYQTLFLQTFAERVRPHPWPFAFVKAVTPSFDWSSLPEPVPYPEELPPESEFPRTEEGMRAYLADIDPSLKQAILDRYIPYTQEREANDRQALARVRRALNDTPHAWLALASLGLASGEGAFAAAFLIALLLSVLVPPAVLVAVFLPSLVEARAFRIRVDAAEARALQDETPLWEAYENRLRTSEHAAVLDAAGNKLHACRHLFLGYEPFEHYPILLHEDLLNEHLHIVGGSGSGKTSLGLLPLLIQLIRGRFDDEAAPLRSGRPKTPQPPIVILDMKGDRALFHTVLDEVRRKVDEENNEAERRNDPTFKPRTLQDAFRLFSCDLDQATHYFNPFQNLQLRRNRVTELCNLFLESLNLNHGIGYGRSYYTLRSRALLQTILQQENPPRSFPELYQALNKHPDKWAYREAYELVATVQSLVHYNQLVTDRDTPPEQTVQMSRVLEDRQVVYCWMPFAEHSTTARAIAHLIVYAFYVAKREWYRAGREPRQAYLFIDEFQNVASANFAEILNAARGFGLSLVLAHQSESQLKQEGYDLPALVEENTNLKMVFSLADVNAMKRLSERSGVETAWMRSYSVSSSSEGKSSTTVSYSESLKPRVTVDDIIDVSDSPEDFFLTAQRGRGYTQFGGHPVRVRTLRPVSRTAHRHRDRTPWPTWQELGMAPAAVVQASPQDVEILRQQELAKADAFLATLYVSDPALRFRKPQENAPS